MWKTKFYIQLIVVLIITTTRRGDAVCNVCNSNGAACVSNNTFNLCYGDIPDITKIYNCLNANEICTVLGQICMDSDSNANVQAACGNTKQCGQCEGVENGAYTCTSRSTFTMCMDNALTNVRGRCRIGEVCRTTVAHSGRTPCVNECLMDVTDMCDVNSAVDAPPASVSADTTVIIQPTPPLSTVAPIIGDPSAPATATSASGQSTEAPCAGRTQVGRYPNPADNGCTSYLYCSSSGSGLIGRTRSCPVGRYFNPVISNCQTTKPSGCI